MRYGDESDQKASPNDVPAVVSPRQTTKPAKANVSFRVPLVISRVGAPAVHGAAVAWYEGGSVVLAVWRRENGGRTKDRRPRV